MLLSVSVMEIIFILTIVSVLFIILLSVRKANLDVERRLTDVITRELKEIRGNVDISSRDMTEQVSSFIRETTNIKEKMNVMQETVKGITSFQEFFRSPKI